MLYTMERLGNVLSFTGELLRNEGCHAINCLSENLKIFRREAGAHMTENAIENDILFQTHRCPGCGWTGDEDELTNGMAMTADEVLEANGEPTDYEPYDGCPNCGAQVEDINPQD